MIHYRSRNSACESCARHFSTTYSYYGTVEPIRDDVTGNIVYEGTEAVGKALLFWRCLMQWLGGLGIIVLFVAVLPALGVGGKILMFAEVPGAIKDSFTPRIKESATFLWKIYLGLTVLQIAALKITNLTLPCMTPSPSPFLQYQLEEPLRIPTI